ncbi:MAG: TonB-dependent receptor [Gammaproteobacteria bacterium]|nr:TonB-dependent receptor [Gammaproteobacteria bacterium]MDH4314050.1 TonB-dependent receptor [Gammaproteobacteria bacterium]MDH5213510.1 TonB-dependent receptor [Gammaproteobacteria bacterium]
MRGFNPTKSIIKGLLSIALGVGAAGLLPDTGSLAFAQGNAILEEITVTAQRREENLQEVPISVTAMSGERMATLFEGGEDIRALAARIPSLYAESSNGRLAPRFYMRGLGNTDFDLAASQSVSILFDEVVQENVILKSFPLFDIERVEVLRGPQGTLFGRNTPAGIVKFDTRKPTADFDGYALATVGSAGTMNIEGAVGGSLNDAKTLQGRISLLSQNRDDWIDNAYTGENDAMGGWNELAWRGQLLWAPTDNFSALLNYHGRDMDNGTASIFQANILTTGSNALNNNFHRDRVFFDEGDNNPQEAQAAGGSLKLDFDFGNDMTLTSISAYETVKNRSLGDIDGGFGAVFLPEMGPGFIPFPSVTQDGLDDLDQFTQEFRLASQATDSFFWQAGVFYFDSDFSVTTSPFFVPSTTVRHENTSWAVFGHVSFDLTDRTTLTAGVRYTDDDKDMSVTDTPPFNPLPPGILAGQPVSVADEQVSWDLSLMYAVNDDFNLYGRVASGFRAPTIQGRNIAFFDANPYSIATSETILSSELGFKSTIGDRMRLNGSVFYYTIDDQQLSAIGGNANSNVLVNADKGTGFGVDFDAEILLTDNLILTLGGSWNDTEIDDANLVTAMPCGVPTNTARRCTVLDPLDTDGFAILDGNPFPQAPEYLFNAVLRYSMPVDGGDLFFQTDWAFQGDAQFFLYESTEFHSGDIYEGGVRAGFTADDNRWELAVFGRNITDAENLKGAIDFNNNTGFVNDRRIWGASFKINFGAF